MKQAWSDLKSFVTVSMIFLLFIIVIANLFGLSLQENILILVSNLITSVFTYYFAKKLEEAKMLENTEKSGNETILPKQ